MGYLNTNGLKSRQKQGVLIKYSKLLTKGLLTKGGSLTKMVKPNTLDSVCINASIHYVFFNIKRYFVLKRALEKTYVATQIYPTSTFCWYMYQQLKIQRQVSRFLFNTNTTQCSQQLQELCEHDFSVCCVSIYQGMFNALRSEFLAGPTSQTILLCILNADKNANMSLIPQILQHSKSQTPSYPLPPAGWFLVRSGLALSVLHLLTSQAA